MAAALQESRRASQSRRAVPLACAEAEGKGHFQRGAPEGARGWGRFLFLCKTGPRVPSDRAARPLPRGPAKLRRGPAGAERRAGEGGGPPFPPLPAPRQENSSKEFRAAKSRQRPCARTASWLTGKLAFLAPLSPRFSLSAAAWGRRVGLVGGALRCSLVSRFVFGSSRPRSARSCSRIGPKRTFVSRLL